MVFFPFLDTSFWNGTFWCKGFHNRSILVRQDMALETWIHFKTCIILNTYTQLHERANTYTHIHTHTLTYTHIHTHTHTYIHTYIHTCTRSHTHTHTYTHTYIYTHIHTYIHTLTYTHIHTYIHTRLHNILLHIGRVFAHVRLHPARHLVRQDNVTVTLTEKHSKLALQRMHIYL